MYFSNKKKNEEERNEIWLCITSRV